LTRAIRSGRPYAAVTTARVVVRPRTIDDARVTDTDTTARETRMVVRLLASSRAALSTTSSNAARHIPFRFSPRARCVP
tara:strand:- start:5762 stop:5998 length:237 start_codon:yes stop_codon:yes gene_type:complete